MASAGLAWTALVLCTCLTTQAMEMAKVCTSDSPHRTVILWTAPRCLSTAFERAIVQLKGDGVRIMHEPFGGPHYFGKERQSHRFKHEPNNPNETFTRILDGLRPNQSDAAVTFSKDMAYYLRSRDDVAEMLINDPMVTHTFLIRNPAKTVPSLHVKSQGAKEGEVNEITGAGWDHFDEREVGFLDLLDLFRKAKESSGKDPTVLDADLVLTDPEKMLKMYCDATGLPYKEGMTSWTPGPVDGWEAWPGWHDDAIKSSGLIQRKVPKPAPQEEEIAAMPEKVRHAIQASMPAYVEMLRSAVATSDVALLKKRS
eukprot:TRINITY_DN94228_c0_g1_i1.p1 TRINITY_DN94228_c0_g1~~TRINITY_DN94228_c0_g1_i1.p1  ORF type:complete len:334 (-),score=68.95 TRINITY_DN94228_c0_g1_i1:42-980(-)